MRIFKSFLCIMSTVIILCNACNLGVFAADHTASEYTNINMTETWEQSVDIEASLAASSENPISWGQTDTRWGQFIMAPGSDTIKKSGCYVTSIASFIGLTGTGGEGFSPLVFYRHLAMNSGWTSSSALNAYSGNVQFNDEFFFVRKEVTNATESDIVDALEADPNVYIIIKLNNGSSQHWVPIVEVVDGRPKFSDSAAANDTTTYFIGDKYGALLEFRIFGSTVPVCT